MNNEKDLPRYRLYKGDAFLIAYGEFLEPEKGSVLEQFKDFITKECFTVKDTDASYRLINHWCSLGLLQDKRDDNKSWRKYSITDLVWIKALVELRNFGLPLEKLREGYKSLRGTQKKKTELLEFAIFCAFIKKASYLIMFQDGILDVAVNKEVLSSESLGILGDISYVVVSINNCLKSLYPSKDFRPKANIVELTPEEMTLLTKIRLENPSEINIKFKDDKIERIDTKTTVLEGAEQMADLLEDFAFGELNIKRKDNKTVCVEKTVKEKV